jgi:hypothetical protein
MAITVLAKRLETQPGKDLALLLVPFSKPHARATAVLVDELDASRL